jgi:hypothetical protein
MSDRNFFYLQLWLEHKRNEGYVIVSNNNGTHFVLDLQMYTWSWIFIVLVHWNNSPGVGMSLHTRWRIIRVRTNQYLFLFP